MYIIDGVGILDWYTGQQIVEQDEEWRDLLYSSFAIRAFQTVELGDVLEFQLQLTLNPSLKMRKEECNWYKDGNVQAGFLSAHYEQDQDTSFDQLTLPEYLCLALQEVIRELFKEIGGNGERSFFYYTASFAAEGFCKDLLLGTSSVPPVVWGIDIDKHPSQFLREFSRRLNKCIQVYRG